MYNNDELCSFVFYFVEEILTIHDRKKFGYAYEKMDGANVFRLTTSKRLSPQLTPSHQKQVPTILA